MNLTIDQLKENLKLLGVINLTTNKLIPFTGFKNRCTIHKYGKKLKIVFLGQPKENLFGFYVMYDTDLNVLKESYQMLLNLIENNDISQYYDDDIQWGNAGIPIQYSHLRTT